MTDNKNKNVLLVIKIKCFHLKKYFLGYLYDYIALLKRASAS